MRIPIGRSGRTLELYALALAGLTYSVLALRVRLDDFIPSRCLPV